MPAGSDKTTTVLPAKATDLEAARAGDEHAFARIVAPVRTRLVAFVLRRGRDVLRADSDADDLVQQTLHTAWRRLPDFEDRGEQSLLRWLVTIAGRVIHDRAKYLDAKDRRAVRQTSTSVLGQLADQGTSIPGRVEKRLQAARLQRALAQLAAPQRDVVERHLLEARSFSDIANELGITKNAAWERLHRGLLRLRDALREESR